MLSCVLCETKKEEGQLPLILTQQAWSMYIQNCFLVHLMITGQLPEVVIKKNKETAHAFQKVTKGESKIKFKRKELPDTCVCPSLQQLVKSNVITKVLIKP